MQLCCKFWQEQGGTKLTLYVWALYWVEQVGCVMVLGSVFASL